MFEKIKQYWVAFISLGLLAVSGLFVANDRLGYSVATGYESTVRSSMSTSQTFVRVSSLALKDGETLDMTKLGSRVFLTIEPGKAKEEIVMCTTINTSTVSFENCTRGLAFSGTSTVSVANNQKTHNAGARIVLSNVHYVYEQLTDIDTDQTVSGQWEFEQYPTVTTSLGNPTLGNQLVNKDYLDALVAGSFSVANVSTTRGLSVDGSAPERVGINASSTTGMAFDAQGKLYQIVNGLKGLAAAVDGLFIKISNKLTFNNDGELDVVATSTPTANIIPISNASSTLNGWLDFGYQLSTTSCAIADYCESFMTAPTGSVFVGGGFSLSAPNGELVYEVQSYPISSTTWKCAADLGNAGDTGTMRCYAFSIKIN